MLHEDDTDTEPTESAYVRLQAIVSKLRTLPPDADRDRALTELDRQVAKFAAAKKSSNVLAVIAPSSCWSQSSSGSCSWSDPASSDRLRRKRHYHRPMGSGSRWGTLVATSLGASVLLAACADVLGLGSLRDVLDGGSDASTGTDTGSDGTTTTDAANDGATASDGSNVSDGSDAGVARDAASDASDASNATDARDAGTDANEADAIAACQKSCTVCKSCLVPGKIAVCANIPSGVDDTLNHCSNNAVCDGTGSCGTAAGKGHFGDPCTVDSDCFGGACGAGTCKLASGQPCADDPACKSNRCVANVCATCITGPECASGICNAAAGTAASRPAGSLCADAGEVRVRYVLPDVEGLRRPGDVHGRGLHHALLQQRGLWNVLEQQPVPAAGPHAPAAVVSRRQEAFCRQSTDCASGTCEPAPFVGTATCPVAPGVQEHALKRRGRLASARSTPMPLSDALRRTEDHHGQTRGWRARRRR